MKVYLHVKGKITLSEALRSTSFQSVQLRPEEEELLSLHLAREPPAPLPLPPLQPRLRCAFCLQEFTEHEARRDHYVLHTSGLLPVTEVPPTFHCTLCPAEFASVGARREHYPKRWSTKHLTETAVNVSGTW